MQGLLELANVPYVGCGVLASAVGMDKAVMKRVFGAAGLPQCAYDVVLRRRVLAEPEVVAGELMDRLGLPVFVKPANLGSSVGISKVRTPEELVEALGLAADYDRKVVVEAAVPHAREIEIAVLGNDDPIASVPGEIMPSREFYDYEAKYLDGSSRLAIPADVPADMGARLQALGCRCVPRDRRRGPGARGFPRRLARRARCSSTRSTRCPASRRSACTASCGPRRG